MVGALIRKAVGSWTLERKSLLFFGSALLVSICLSFWFVQRKADELVMLTTRQAARDYAHTVVLWKHVIKFGSLPPQTSPFFTPNKRTGIPDDMMQQLQEMFINTTAYEYSIVALDPLSQHQDLPDALPPDSEFERELLSRLETEVRQKLAAPPTATTDGSGAAASSQSNSTSSSTNSSTASASPAVAGGSGATPPSSSSASESSPPAGEQPGAGPAPVQLENMFIRSSSGSQPSFREAGPINNTYRYYHPISFQKQCMECHHPKNRAAGAGPFDPVKDAPFLVVKVSMPYDATHVTSVAIQASMIALAMVTLAGTLLVLHLILRKLVIRPLRHLRDVSEEISRGRYDLRAEIDTDDEFNDLADAFNRMLRHLTDTQGQLRSLNTELDKKVDQLAQANLHLYEANRLKSDFLANMSHELRTPLNSIIGFSDVLQDISSLTDKQKRYAANIQKSGRMLLEMINDILDLAKIEAGKLEVRPTAFDLNQVVQAQSDMMRSLSEDKNIDLQVHIDPVLESVFQDQPKIQQILTNLLSNAIKFTPEGGLVTVTTGSVGDETLHITVADTGVGIPESDFEVIFEKFRQSNAILQGGDNLTRQYSGTGLGLSIVKELCRLLGGEVTLASHVGKGSTFRVTLPRNYTTGEMPVPSHGFGVAVYPT